MFMDIQFGNRIFEVWPLSAVIFAFTAVYLYRRGQSLSYLFFLAMFWLYLSFTIDKVFFPIAITGDFAEGSRRGCPIPIVNLTLFYFGSYPDFTRVLISSLQNIISTIPFGFGLNFIAMVKPRNFLVIAFSLGLSFEMIQYALSRLLGYCYRVSDVNDVMLNAIGVLVGYGLFCIFAWYYTTIVKKLNIRCTGIVAYTYDVSLKATSASTKDLLTAKKISNEGSISL